MSRDIRTFINILNENDSNKKAGMIPYYIENGIPHMAFMISSNPAFGGADPMVSKGNVDKGESLEETAIREMYEEIGIDPSKLKNVFHATTRNIEGKESSYSLTIFGGELEGLEETNPGYETREVVWFTPDEMNKLRKSHVPLVKEFLRVLGY